MIIPDLDWTDEEATRAAKLLEQMSEPADNFDFEDAGRRLKIIQSEVADYTQRWEIASEELEQLEA